MTCTRQAENRSPLTREVISVLAHAVLLVSAELEEVNQRANDFEVEAGSGRYYEAQKLVTVREAMSDDIVLRDMSLVSLVSDALKNCLATIAPPA